MATSYTTKLQLVEAFRARVLLEEGLKKLNFLSSLQSSASVHGDELTQFMGDEISRIIQEQRDLEKKYEELIAERGQLKGLCNKSQFKKVQDEIVQVAHRLKESNKSLCRNLKENPNVQGNLEKMKAERQLVQEWLEETMNDLLEMSFANLVQKVDTERHEQERLTEVKRKEKEASNHVKALEAELARENIDHEKETKSANQEIKELKEELQKNKTISDIEFKFEEKKLRAREEALLRIHKQEEKTLKEELDALLSAEKMEKGVHEKANDFLEEKVADLFSDKSKWNDDYEQELAAREADCTDLSERRKKCNTELQELIDKRRKEAMEQKAKEDDMRNAVIVEKQRREQLQRMADAVLFLQEEGRRYIGCVAARNALKKGKKGKKGKKK